MPFAFLSKLVFVWNNSYENVFPPQIHFHANQFIFVSMAWTRLVLKPRHKGTRKSHPAFLKAKLLPNGHVFFTLFNMAKTKHAGSLERLLFSRDNDCEQKMFQQAEPVNKRCLHRLKSAKKNIFLTRISCQPSPRRVYFDYWVITFFSPWLFLRIKNIFGDTFLPTIYEEL